MKTTSLIDGTTIYCISPTEGQMLYEHINGYLNHSLIKINEGDTVIDVGANIGVLGIKLSKMFSSNIEIFCFEPIKPIFKVLEKNAELSNNINFKFFEWGISDKNELMSCTYYPNSPALSTANPEMWNSNDELISALEGNLKHSPENWWWARYIPKFMYPYIVWRLKKNPQEMKCQLKTLSESIRLCKIKKIDLLKIDCEGNELKVINGIQNEDWDIIKQLIIEVHDIGNRLDYIQNLLKDKNYNVQIVKEPSLENTALYNLYAQR
tara:strand:- start:637 stop:1434 length:798 start_codon:yes stop_codon:yes gene_type:complete